VSLLLLFRLGLRKGELARVQFKHYEGRNLTMFGKGGKVRYLPVVERVLRLQLEQHILDRQPEPDEFLLHPEKGLTHRPMHEARHTAITDFLRQTANLKLAQILAGHADIGTTANIYAHLDTSDVETAPFGGCDPPT
jgi:integrase